MRTRLMLPAVLALLAASASGAVFQYRLPVRTARGEREAFLWLPADAQRVRGVVVAGMTLMERRFAADPVIRRACRAEALGVLFFRCGLGSVDIPQALDALAAASGYAELRRAPLLFVGHSAGGPQAKACAVKYAARCFGLVQYRGGGPGDEPPLPPGIPALMMVGQFDEFGGTMRTADGREQWQGAAEHLAAWRAADAGRLGSLVVEPGAGHFGFSRRNAEYLALFLRKAAAARIGPAGRDAEGGEPALKKIDPRSGWLTDLALVAPAHRPARWAEYAGERSGAAWHVDEQLARATAAYHEGLTGRADQFIRWADPHWVDAGARFFFTKISWVGDGRTFEVHPVYADAYPSQYGGRGPKWPLAGRPVGHSDAPIVVRPVGGPIEAAGGRRLRIRFDGLAPAGERFRAAFLACSAGDRRYRYTEQVGMLPRGFRGLTKGRAQTITFPAVGDLRPGGPPVPLKAVSDASLPVEYYVAYGPAVVEGGMLKVAELPARAKLPVEVKVVAWQFGRGVEPLVRTAEPVARTLHVVR